MAVRGYVDLRVVGDGVAVFAFGRDIRACTGFDTGYMVWSEGGGEGWGEEGDAVVVCVLGFEYGEGGRGVY